MTTEAEIYDALMEEMEGDEGYVCDEEMEAAGEAMEVDDVGSYLPDTDTQGVRTQLTFSQATLTDQDQECAVDSITMTGPRGNVKCIAFAPLEDSDAEDDPRPPGSLLCGKTIDQLTAERLEKQRRSKVTDPLPTAQHSQLLVDRYRPLKFVDLTSSEETNLHVLEWFKKWDTLSFNNKPHDPKQGPMPDPRPDPRILLLAGPPGAGKTTLATVISDHCGYRTVQVNASMDRTASSLDERINVAVTGATTLDPRPSCLILDEVDGIAHSNGPGVLSSLIKLSKMEWKNRGKKPMQLRPVVCICNNPWVKELRDLREVSEFIRMDSVSTFKLSQRLGDICSTEGISADTSALRELCNLSHGDIRSCLFTLQFLAQRYHSKRITQKQITGVGIKDRVPSFVDVMDAIFYGDDAKAAAAFRTLGYSDANRFTGKHSVALLRHMTKGHPEMDRLFEACYNEYLTAKYHDYDLAKTSKVARLVSNYDTLQTTAREKAAFGIIIAYGPQMLVDFHSICQATKLARKKWFYPKTFAEQARKKERGAELIDTYLGPNRLYLTRRDMVLDFLSPLLAALAPQTIKAKKSFHVETGTDKDAFEHLVKLHAQHKVTYVAKDDHDRQTSAPIKKLVMQPDLSSLAWYGKTCRRFFRLDDIIKVRLMTALKLHAIKGDAAPLPKKQQKEAQAKQTEEPRKRKLEAQISGLKKRSALRAPPKKSVKRDMFGNVIKAKSPSPRSSSAAKRAPSLLLHPMYNPDVGCKYEQNKGFTNAVRRKALWEEWL